MTGRQECIVLKGIRKQIAEKLGVDLHQKECTFEGECKGTCLKCEQEEKVLNAALLKKGAALAGAAALSLSLAACTPVGDAPSDGNNGKQPPSGVSDPADPDDGDRPVLMGDVVELPDD